MSVDVRRERPTTPPSEHEVDVAPSGAASTRIRSGASAAAAGRRPLSPHGPPLTEEELMTGYRNAAVAEEPA